MFDLADKYKTLSARASPNPYIDLKGFHVANGITITLMAEQKANRPAN